MSYFAAMNPVEFTLTNKQISEAFEQLAQLMEIHGQNPFRAKAIATAGYRINKLPFSASSKTEQELTETPGIGASTATKIKSLLQTGTLPELEDLREQTPIGIQEMLGIKGLGPKKILTLWKELGLESLGEVYYACNENRLVGTKGFGLKTQEQIKQIIEFTFANSGWLRYASIEPEAERILADLQKALPVGRQVAFTGNYRRKAETLQRVDILAEASVEELLNAAAIFDGWTQLENGMTETALKEADVLEYRLENNFHFRLLGTTGANFTVNLFLSTGSPEHIEQLAPVLETTWATEQDIYEALGLNYIEPELREGLGEIERAQRGKLPALITLRDLKGSLHNHSTYSDGIHSLEEMASYAKNEMGLEYLGIADHSKSAFYARGLSVETLQEQWKEIDILNERLAPFQIFKGIESDILADGSLDYPDEVLESFDFVVASVHTNLRMDKAKATERLVRAIENPYTTILGHPTGRLLLSRAGYPIDYERVIDACAANQVVIEINANPLRLDLDWRWHQYAISKGVLLSINPDAHRQKGLHDMRYGVYAARKGGLSVENCLNTYSREEIATFFAKRKI